MNAEEYFIEIAGVPRPSGHEEHIREYLKKFAKEHGLSSEEDAAGNVLITKPSACKAPGVVLQAHMDMVPAASPGTAFDFRTQPLALRMSDEWLTAENTTLGADDGAGMALMLAALTAPGLVSGKIECLFTTDEEEGMTGTVGLSPDLLEGRIMLNLDHEDGTTLLRGCAGGVITEAFFTPEQAPVQPGRAWFRLAVGGLKSGHSGIDISCGRANAIKIAAGFISELTDAVCASFSAGTKSNVIPAEAVVLFSVREGDTATAIQAAKGYEQRIQNAYQETDPDIGMRMTPADAPAEMFTPEFSGRFIDALAACPTGVLAMQNGEVLTSTNLAAVAPADNGKISVITLQRSAVNAERDKTAANVSAVFTASGAVVKQYGKFSGWLLERDAPLLLRAARVYENMFGKKPEIETTHGGVECGMIQEKYPDMQIISLGPTIEGCHTPAERLSRASLRQTEQFLFALLRDLAEEKGSPESASRDAQP